MCTSLIRSIGMGCADVFILCLVAIFVNADVQLTLYAVINDYSIHNCMQLLPCGQLKRLEVRIKSECAHQALMIGANMFIYEEGDKICLLCLQTYPGDDFTEVPSSVGVYVKGLVMPIKINAIHKVCKTQFLVVFIDNKLERPYFLYSVRNVLELISKARNYLNKEGLVNLYHSSNIMIKSRNWYQDWGQCDVTLTENIGINFYYILMP